MTQYLPTNFKEKMKKKLDKIELFKKILDPKDIKKFIPEYIKFNEKKENSKRVLSDGTRYWITIQTPEKNEDSEPRESNSKFYDNNYLWICKFRLGQLNMFATKEQLSMMEWNSTILITGKLIRQYKINGEQGYYKNLGALVRSINKKINEITEDDYNISYTFNLYQIIDYLSRSHQKLFTEITQKKLTTKFDDSILKTDLYSEMDNDEINKTFEEITENEYLRDLDDYYSYGEQINLTSKGIQLTVAKEYNIETGKKPIWNNKITNIFKKWIKTKHPDLLKFLNEDNDIIEEAIELENGKSEGNENI